MQHFACGSRMVGKLLTPARHLHDALGLCKSIHCFQLPSMLLAAGVQLAIVRSVATYATRQDCFEVDMHVTAVSFVLLRFSFAFVGVELHPWPGPVPRAQQFRSYQIGSNLALDGDLC